MCNSKHINSFLRNLGHKFKILEEIQNTKQNPSKVKKRKT